MVLLWPECNGVVKQLCYKTLVMHLLETYYGDHNTDDDYHGNNYWTNASQPRVSVDCICIGVTNLHALLVCALPHPSVPALKSASWLA